MGARGSFSVAGGENRPNLAIQDRRWIERCPLRWYLSPGHQTREYLGDQAWRARILDNHQRDSHCD